MKALRIVSNNVISNWWCKNCSNAHNSLYKINQDSFCDECVPEQYKDKLVTVNQNGEVIQDV